MTEVGIVDTIHYVSIVMARGGFAALARKAFTSETLGPAHELGK
jgi:hypothetical protein